MKFRKIYIEITNVCNLDCDFCPKTSRKKEYMSIANYSIIVEKVKDYTNLIALHVKGEPTLHQDLYEIIEKTHELGLKVDLTTNGTDLAKITDKMLNIGAIRQINISMHSPAEKTNIEAELKRISEYNVYISLRSWNQDEDIYFKGEKISDNIYINKAKKFIWPDINNQKINKKGTCLGLKTHIAILVDGTVVPCCLDNNGDIKLGNLLKESLESILIKEKTRNIISGFNENRLVEELCQKCAYRKN